MPRAIRKWDELEKLADCASRDWNDNGKRVFTGLVIALGFAMGIYLMIASLWILLRALSI